MNRIKMVSFSEENMHTVLGWRNAGRIRSNMLDDSIIQEKDHKNFLKILGTDPSRGYFILEFKGAPVAAIYFTGLGTDEVTWGCYIGAEKAIPGLFVALVVIAAEYTFSLPTTKALRSEVAAHNSNPIKLNKFLKIPEVRRLKKTTSSGREIDFIEYRLERDAFDTVLMISNKIMPSSIKEACENLSWEK